MQNLNLTHVEEIYKEGVCNYRCIFGHFIKEEIVEQQFGITIKRKWYEPNSIICLSLWDATKAGKTKRWKVYVLKTGQPGQLLTSIPQVTPGAEVLLSASGAKKCTFLLKWLEELEGQGDPTKLEANYFTRRDLWLQSISPESSQIADLYLEEFIQKNPFI